MRIVSVNVGLPQEVSWRGSIVRTAIFKAPVSGKVRVEHLNFEGDRQANLEVHGGRDKAVYGYPLEHYDLWANELGTRPSPLGAFGENLTFEGLMEPDICIGDQLAVGSSILQVTQPRMPCSNLQVRFDRTDMTKLFALSLRCGFYFSVRQEGDVESGDSVEVVYRDTHRISVAEINQLYFSKSANHTRIREVLEFAHLTVETRSTLLQRLHA